MKSNNNNVYRPVIKCPCCGAEYLPGELYMPGSITGKPTEVIRDSFGKIIYEDYHSKLNEPDLIERYECDICKRPFVIEAVISYRAKEEELEKDFSSKYVSLLDD